MFTAHVHVHDEDTLSIDQKIDGCEQYIRDEYKGFVQTYGISLTVSDWLTYPLLYHQEARGLISCLVKRCNHTQMSYSEILKLISQITNKTFL